MHAADNGIRRPTARASSFAVALLIVAGLGLVTPAIAADAGIGKALAGIERLITAKKIDEAEAAARKLVQSLAGKPDAKLDEARAEAVSKLARVLELAGRFGDAEAADAEALRLRQAAKTPDGKLVAASLFGIADMRRRDGRYGDAEKPAREALALREAVEGKQSVVVGETLNLLAIIVDRLGRSEELEALLRRAIAVGEANGDDGRAVLAESLARLADLISDQGRPDLAEPLAKRSVALLTALYGTDDPELSRGLIRLGNIQLEAKQAEAAVLSFGEAVRIRENAFGVKHPTVGGALGNLARAQVAAGKFADAEKVLQRALTIQIAERGADHPSVGKSFNTLGDALTALGRFVEAEDAFARALEIREARFGDDHPDVAETLGGFGQMAFKQGRFVEAYQAFRRAADIFIRRARVRSPEEAAQRPGNLIEIAVFEGLAEAAFEVADLDTKTRSERLTEAYEAQQWALQSRTGLALEQMASRFAVGSSPLAATLREIHELTRARAAADRRHLDLLAKGDAPKAARELVERELDRLDTTILERRATLARSSPEFAELTDPDPLPIAATQKLLGPDEALVSYMVNVDHTMVWAVTRERTAWLRSPIGRKELDESIEKLRLLLDTPEKKKEVGEGVAVGAFDLALSHRLYERLLGPVTTVIAGKKHLLLVPAAGLTSLPFQVLVTKPAAAGAESAAKAPIAWLIRDYALSVLPTVSSLRALRLAAKVADASSPFVGFGDPVFSRSGGGPRRQDGVEAAPAGGFARYFRAGRADLDALSEGLVDLPETAIELDSVAASLGSGKDVVFTERKATEARVKEMSRAGKLANFRVLHFATHALVAGEVSEVSRGLSEPALALSLPDKATREDDGLLTASEVAELRLNASLVVLSACNTAAGDSQDAEALSGLARSFFFAGARGLLVSHWYVNSDAAVDIVTKAMSELSREPSIGRAEALRRAMLAEIDKTEASGLPDPSRWAPFVLVGDGQAVN